jgi:hypothetical protein
MGSTERSPETDFAPLPDEIRNCAEAEIPDAHIALHPHSVFMTAK